MFRGRAAVDQLQLPTGAEVRGNKNSFRGRAASPRAYRAGLESALARGLGDVRGRASGGSFGRSPSGTASREHRNSQLDWSTLPFRHEPCCVVNHSKEIVNVFGLDTNRIESVWGALKRWLRKRGGGRLPLGRVSVELCVWEFLWRKKAAMQFPCDSQQCFMTCFECLSILDICKFHMKGRWQPVGLLAYVLAQVICDRVRVSKGNILIAQMCSLVATKMCMSLSRKMNQ